MVSVKDVKDMVKLHRLHSKFTFGRFEGRTLRSVIDSGDGDYILLAVDSIVGFTTSKKVKELLVNDLLAGEGQVNQTNIPNNLDTRGTACGFGCKVYDPNCYCCTQEDYYNLGGRY